MPADPHAVFEQARAAYGSGEYEEALELLDEGARIEPTRARWPFNRAFALRERGRYDEAVEALRKARALEPEFRTAEIDQLLAELEERRAAKEQSDLWFKVLAAAFGVVVFGGFYLFTRRGQPSGMAQRLGALGGKMVTLERRLATCEDEKARAYLETAALHARKVRKLLSLHPLEGEQRRDASSCLASAEQHANLAAIRLDACAGQAKSAQPTDRMGCWFCARPLAHPSSRVECQLRLGTQSSKAVVCPDCAALARKGRPPMMTMLQGPERLVHWALAPEYDLYRHRHLPKPEVRRAWIHEAAPGLDDLEETAVAAAGGETAYGSLAVTGEEFDLEALGRAAVTEAAAAARAELEAWERSQNEQDD